MMIRAIADLLGADKLAELRRIYDRGKFVDGKATAGSRARRVKNNTQLGPGTDHAAARKLVGTVLAGHSEFTRTCFTARIGPMLFSRYEPGHTYGAHVDNALMTMGTTTLRSDISYTLFVSDQSEYEGGELITEINGVEHSFKLPAGHAVIYPSTTLHHVAPVTSGARMVVAGWIQSLIRDVEKRALLYDLGTVLRNMVETQGESRDYELLARSQANLFRMWAEP